MNRKQTKQRRRINEKRTRHNRLVNNIPGKHHKKDVAGEFQRLDFTGQMPEKSPKKSPEK